MDLAEYEAGIISGRFDASSTFTVKRRVLTGPYGNLWVSAMDAYIGHSSTVASASSDSVRLNGCGGFYFPWESIEPDDSLIMAQSASGIVAKPCPPQAPTPPAQSINPAPVPLPLQYSLAGEWVLVDIDYDPATHTTKITVAPSSAAGALVGSSCGNSIAPVQDDDLVQQDRPESESERRYRLKMECRKAIHGR